MILLDNEEGARLLRARGEVTKGEVWDESREGPHRSHVCCDMLHIYT